MSDNLVETPPLEESLGDPIWDDEFWTAMEKAERKACLALQDLADRGFDGDSCVCDVCNVRTVLEAVWPTLTEQFNRLLNAGEAAKASIACPSTKCGGGCGRCGDE